MTFQSQSFHLGGILAENLPYVVANFPGAQAICSLDVSQSQPFFAVYSCLFRRNTPALEV